MKNLKSNLLLILAAFIWGAAFTAQSTGMEYIGPFTFNGIRFIIGGLVLLPVVFITTKGKAFTGQLFISGIACGVVLAIASSLQQIGIQYTSPGKAGFITALYVIMVPIFGLFMGRRSGFLLWISAILAVIGMYLLCLSGGTSINHGDFLVFLCAIAFTFHILVIDKFAPAVDGIALSCIQFFTAGVLCSVIIPFTETVEWASVKAAGGSLLYTGVLSCGVAYTLQVVGQKKTQPVVASVLLSLESVFSVITAWIVLGDVMSVREVLGCCIVFAAIILAQLPTPKKAVIKEPTEQS